MSEDETRKMAVRTIGKDQKGHGESNWRGIKASRIRWVRNKRIRNRAKAIGVPRRSRRLGHLGR